jgi:predicted HTH domain antitoxin
MDPIRRVNTTMPESLLRKIDFYSELNFEDRATAIRQLIAEGLRVRLEKTVLERYRERSVTLRQAAEMLGITYPEMDELLNRNRIPLVEEPRAAYRRSVRPLGRKSRRRS